MKIVSLVPLAAEYQDKIRAVDPSIELVSAPGWFDGELREAWGDHTADAYLRPGSNGSGTRAERDALLVDADIVVSGFPPPIDLVARAPKLRWFHQTPAGASNLLDCDLWGSEVVVTTSRGLGNTLAIAEYVVAAFLHFARGLHRAEADRTAGRFDRLGYRPRLLAGKTACVVGAGGIGRDVGRLCAALGMRVVGTRRDPNGDGDGVLPEGFDEVAGPDRLHKLLAESTFVAVCCHWTPETEGLIDAQALAAMPDGAVIVNVARGEVIDEAALADALDRLGGAALDVYVGEFDHPPPESLWHHPNVLLTPHISAGAEDRSARPIELFRSNLAAFLAGEPMQNVIDWERGY